MKGKPQNIAGIKFIAFSALRKPDETTFFVGDAVEFDDSESFPSYRGSKPQLNQEN